MERASITAADREIPFEFFTRPNCESAASLVGIWLLNRDELRRTLALCRAALATMNGV
jgi:hypothetical protein